MIAVVILVALVLQLAIVALFGFVALPGAEPSGIPLADTRSSLEQLRWCRFESARRWHIGRSVDLRCDAPQA